jgi:formate dehydrogenase formation protein
VASSTIPVRRRDTVSRVVAEQFGPILTVHKALSGSARASVDVADARARVTSGRPAFDAVGVLKAAGDLKRPFERAAVAFEHSGVASTSSIASVRSKNADVKRLVLGWANGDLAAADPGRNLARRIAGVVGNAILRRVASDLAAELSYRNWSAAVCPGCGAAPDLAFTTTRRRTLVCWRCDTKWRAPTTGCLGCGAEGPPTIARIASPYLGYELAICNGCGRYLKERRGALTYDPLVERALTAGLDAAAEGRGLRL